MKHCSHCDIDVDNSYNLCPYCGQELMHLEHEKIHDTAYWQGEAAHCATSTRPERATEIVFEEADGHSVKINGMVVECTTQQYYQSKLTKIVQSVFHGEPYQLSHTTFVTVFRVQEHVFRGFAEQARDIIVYGNVQNVLSTGDDVTIVAKMLMCDKVTPQYDRQPPLLFRTKGHSIRRVHDFMLYLKY